MAFKPGLPFRHPGKRTRNGASFGPITREDFDHLTPQEKNYLFMTTFDNCLAAFRSLNEYNLKEFNDRDPDIHNFILGQIDICKSTFELFDTGFEYIKQNIFYQTILDYIEKTQGESDESKKLQKLQKFEPTFNALIIAGYNDASIGFNYPDSSLDFNELTLDKKREIFNLSCQNYTRALRLLNNQLKKDRFSRAHYLTSFFAERTMFYGNVFKKLSDVDFKQAESTLDGFNKVKERVESLIKSPDKDEKIIIPKSQIKYYETDIER